MLNLKHLYYFHTFAHLRSTAAAAKRLGISSPALSNQLKELDSFLGAKLSRRVDRKVEITEIGEIVLNYTDQMFAIYEQLQGKLSAARDFKNTRFRIGISHYLGARFSFDLLSLIVKPHLSFSQKVHVTFASSDELLGEFAKENFEIVIGAFPTDLVERNSWVAHSLSFPVRLFAPTLLHEAAKQKFGNLQQVDLAKLIVLANEMQISFALTKLPSILREETDKILQNAGVFPERTIECNSSAAIVQLIERGFAMGLVPAPSLLDFKSAGLLATLGPPQGFWNQKISILTHKEEGITVAKPSPLDEMFAESQFT